MTCSILSSTPGALAVFSTFVFPSSAGTMLISNDSPGTHSIVIEAIAELVEPVQGVDLSGPMTLTPILSGDNSGAEFTGADSKSVVLANAGTDTLSLEVQGSLTSTAKAGTYQVQATVLCI